MKKKLLACLLLFGTATAHGKEGIISSILDGDFLAEVEPSLDEIYRQAFGTKPPSAPAKLKIPLYINKGKKAEVLVVLSDFKVVDLIERETLVNALAPTIRDEEVDRIIGGLPPGEMIPPSALEDYGIEVIYDSYRQVLDLRIPPDIVGRLRTSLTRGFTRPGAYMPVIETGCLSNIFNYRVTKSFEHERPTGSTARETPWIAEFDNALQYRSFVLESYVTYDESADEKFVPYRVRIVKDFEKALLRTTAGDVDSAQFGYLNPRTLGGAGLRTFFGVDPYLLTYPQGDLRLFLDSDSTVEVFVNGSLVSTLELPAGEHEIIDVPYGGGFSEYELIVTDAYGRERVIAGHHAIESQLLDPAIPEYGFFAGYPVVTPGGRKRYITENFNTIGYFRKGITNQLTVGFHEQTDKDVGLIGGEAVYGSPFGVFEWNVGVSFADDLRTDFASRILWNSPTRWSIDCGWPYFSIFGEYVGKKFTPVGTSITGTQNDAYTIAGSVSKSFYPGWTMTLRGDYTHERSTTHNPYGLIFTLRKILPHWIFTGDLEYDQTSSGRIVRSAFVRLSYRNDDIYASSSHSTRSQATNFNIDYLPRRNFGASGGVAYTHTPDDDTVTGRMRYRHNKFNFYAANTYNYTKGDGATDFTTVTFASSVLYADGVLALSRPVYDSFLLVDAIPEFEDVEVGVNPRFSYEDYETKLHCGSIGVLATEASYFPNRVEVVAPDLPIGRDLGPARYNFYPTYRSGTRLCVGTDAQAMLQLQVTDTLGNVLDLQAGQLFKEDGKEAIDVFTSKRGLLRTPALTPGTYILKFNDPALKERILFVPQEAEGIFKMDVVIERETTESTP